MCRMWRNESQKGTAQSSADRKTMNLYWIRPAEKTDGVLMSVFQVSVFAKAAKNKGLERSFKQAIPKEVYERLEKEMEQFEAR